MLICFGQSHRKSPDLLALRLNTPSLQNKKDKKPPLSNFRAAYVCADQYVFCFYPSCVLQQNQKTQSYISTGVSSSKSNFTGTALKK